MPIIYSFRLNMEKVKVKVKLLFDSFISETEYLCYRVRVLESLVSVKLIL